LVWFLPWTPCRALWHQCRGWRRSARLMAAIACEQSCTPRRAQPPGLSHGHGLMAQPWGSSKMWWGKNDDGGRKPAARELQTLISCLFGLQFSCSWGAALALFTRAATGPPSKPSHTPLQNRSPMNVQ